MANVLTLEEVANYLRVHPSTIYRLLKKKLLPAFKVGSDWRFNVESIDRWRAEAEDSQFVLEATSHWAPTFSQALRPFMAEQ